VELGAGHRDGRLPDPAERVGQVALGDGLLGDAAEQRVERGAGVGRLDASLGEHDELTHPRHRDRLEQRLLRREVAVDRSRADARPRRDRVERHAVPRFGERLAGSGEHPLAVAAGVGAQWSIGRGQAGRSFRIV